MDFVHNQEPTTSSWDWIEVENQQGDRQDVPMFLCRLANKDEFILENSSIDPVFMIASFFAYPRQYKAAAVIFMWGFGRQPNWLYTCWINHRDSTCESPLNYFINSEKFSIYASNGSIGRTYTLENSQQAELQSFKQVIEDRHSVWTDEDFIYLKEFGFRVEVENRVWFEIQEKLCNNN